MAECDLLSAKGYHETSVGPLLLRVAAVEPPEHPLGAEYTEPHWAIFVSAKHHDLGWLAIFVPATDVDAAIATLDEDSQERTERLSILIGSSWAAVAKSARAVCLTQEAAVVKLPPFVYSCTPEELRRVRDNILATEPELVVTMLEMTYFWALDAGGTNGPRFAA